MILLVTRLCLVMQVRGFASIVAGEAEPRDIDSQAKSLEVIETDLGLL